MHSLLSHSSARAAWYARLALAALVLGATVPAFALPGGGKTPTAIAEADSDQPPAIRGVDVVEHLGEPLPLQARFLDEEGREVRLAEVLPKDKPTLVTLVYYQCPMLCNLVINAQVSAMREVGLELGKDYEALTVSIDPKDTPTQSTDRRRRHLQAMGKPESAPWRFLTGTQENITQLSEALGFQYTYDETTKQYAHPAVVHVITPEGSVSRYLYGTNFPARDMKLALLEAANGRVGTSFDRVMLTCFKYETATKRYGFYVFGFIRTGAMLVFSALSVMLIHFWRRELKKGAAA
jgi:protein SCO1/2